MNLESKILVIVGPTASGKSALAVTLARRFRGEVISADSRQVYRGLDVGTGKITKKEMRGVHHHLLDIANPKKQFTVAEYKKLAREKISQIQSRNKIPIICGGTGLYIDALLGNIAIPEVPPNLALRKKLERKTAPELFALLQMFDPQRAKTIDQHNPRRLIRAIEIIKAIGSVTPSQHTNILQNMRMIGLILPPAELKKKISRRLFVRIREYKMIQEVRELHRKGLSWKRMESLGLEYRYLSRYLRGFLTKTEMIEKLKTEIWRYAKRQMVWFKRNKEIKWFTPKEQRKIFSAVQVFLCQ
ncbi:MAG: tRNA delta(2)-isopentenylpyrophosphate transferase [Parcubacteria group bacterium Gr01-1014_17]|nr:MAG: tRNA delta(2)-isopentenylpyrophosphate transferase [Parcubacteria group bacterium Gr01-1014_17]